MRVAVLGGGLQGCCLAMALADRGATVTLFDRNDRLMSRAAVANEGKIHLGYMYAADPSLKTARAMMRGALSFAPFLSRHLGIPQERFTVSTPATYVVHRESQKPVEEVEAYLEAVHALIGEHPGAKTGYFGLDLAKPIRRWAAGDLSGAFDPGAILAAFDTPEVAIDPVFLADLVRARIADTDAIKVLTGHTIVSVEGEADDTVVAQVSGRTLRGGPFDHVVNALWDGRIALDVARGRRPTRPWIHRLKYGVDLRAAEGRDTIRSVTIVSGPFGEIVNYANGSIYLTWYPNCLRARTSEPAPPHWPIEPGEPERSEILQGTFEALSRILPALGAIGRDALQKAVVRGGPIVAWGETDIDDPASELHRRYEIGVTSQGRYHSVDPGKLTAAPYFAEDCADRIIGAVP